MPGWLSRFGLLALTLLAAFPYAASAHESRPALLEINELKADHYNFVWKVPVRDGATPDLLPRFPEGCEIVGRIERWSSGDAYNSRGEFVCHGRELSGSVIAIDGIENTILETLVRYKDEGGQVTNLLLSRRVPQGNLTTSDASNQSVRFYFSFGVEHILSGWDHLLFLACLSLLIAGWRRLVYCVTGFSIAHATTLAAVSLEMLPRPGAVIEPLIALSILFLAIEAVQNGQGRKSLIQRYPFAIAFVFGLLHGCGFASALADVGLPQGERIAALLYFNLGIEAGQLMFIGLALAGAWGLGKISLAALKPGRAMLAYSAGCIAAYWTLERTFGLFSLA